MTFSDGHKEFLPQMKTLDSLEQLSLSNYRVILRVFNRHAPVAPTQNYRAKNSKFWTIFTNYTNMCKTELGLINLKCVKFSYTPKPKDFITVLRVKLSQDLLIISSTY